MNNDERRQWVLNDEGLYNWLRNSRLSMTDFIRVNRFDIDKVIKEVLG